MSEKIVMLKDFKCLTCRVILKISLKGIKPRVKILGCMQGYTILGNYD